MSYNRIRSKRRGNRRGNGVMRVRIFKSRAPTVNELKAAYYAVEAAATELLNTGHINGFYVAAFTTNKVIGCNRPFTSGNNWLNNNGFTGAGAHVWVTNCNLAVAHSTPGDAWYRRRQGFVGANRYESNFYFGVIAIHESLHPFIEGRCGYVNRKFADINRQPEHSLGHSHFDNGGRRQRFTPMCASYERTSYRYGPTGTCNNGDNDPDGVTRGLSICTEDSMKSSWRHAAGYHNGY